MDAERRNAVFGGVDGDGRDVYVAIPGTDAVWIVERAAHLSAAILGGFRASSAIALPVEGLTNLLFHAGFESD